MDSPILRTTIRWLVVLLFMVAAFLLIRGHNAPGGGFAGGLLAAAAVIITTMAIGAHEGRRLLRWAPATHIGSGLLLAAGSGFAWYFIDGTFLQAAWVAIPLGFTDVKLGTPLLFDIGVFQVVLGSVAGFALSLEEAVHPTVAEEDADADEEGTWKA